MIKDKQTNQKSTKCERKALAEMAFTGASEPPQDQNYRTQNSHKAKTKLSKEQNLRKNKLK